VLRISLLSSMFVPVCKVSVALCISTLYASFFGPTVACIGKADVVCRQRANAYSRADRATYASDREISAMSWMRDRRQGANDTR
jgi:hypothetical protein